jgi:hypothetical protein
MTNHDELQAMWVEYGKRLDASLKLNATLVQQNNLDRAEHALRPLMVGLGWEIASNALSLVLLGWFVADNFTQPRFSIPGGVLFAVAWLTLFACVQQLVALRRIDFEEPVVAIQYALERCRLRRIQTTLWLVFAAPLVWVPLLIVGGRTFGFDAYALGAGYLLANVAVGLGVLGIGMLLAKKVTAGKSRLGDLLAGRSLDAARERLDTIARFAEE